MGTVTDMAMDMAMINLPARPNYLLFCLLGGGYFVIAPSVNAATADLQLKPYVKAGFTASDNVELVREDKESSIVTTLEAGGRLTAEGKESAINLDYAATQAMYSHDSSENKFYQQLELTTRRSYKTSGWSLGLNGAIKNIPQSSSQNASRDLLSGDLVETRGFNGNVKYSNDSRGVVGINFLAKAGLSNSEDYVGDNYNYQTQLTLNEGRLVSNYFWNLAYKNSYYDSARTSRTNESHTMSYELGGGDFWGLSPLLNAYAEKYQQNDSDSTLSQDHSLTYVGPGLRYSFGRNSYIQASYNKVIEGPQKSVKPYYRHWKTIKISTWCTWTFLKPLTK